MNGYIMVSDGWYQPVVYKRDNNGKISLWPLEGVSEFNHKYLNKDFDDMILFESMNYTSYAAFKSNSGWGLIRIDCECKNPMPLISEVSDKLYATLHELQEACSMVFHHYSELQNEDYFESRGKSFSTHKIADGITPAKITHLRPNDVFVFGSNLAGKHAGGAARTANKYFGAEWGVSKGRTGQCYAIPTMQGNIDTIKPNVDKFIQYTKKHPELHFFVTPIGCGRAGFKAQDIAPLFKDVFGSANVNLPQSFIDEIEKSFIV